MTIAIDGPAGSGKSTVARGLAHRLSLRYVDTGAMYRAITLKALRNGVPLDDAESLSKMAVETEIELIDDGVAMDGEDVSMEIRSPKVDAAVSVVAAHEGVRKELVRRQRDMAAGGVVMEGRDIGTVVLLDADLKVFLTASSDERASRRQMDVRATNFGRSSEELKREIEARDDLDSNRKISPLLPASDAVTIDSTTLSAEGVIERILELLAELPPR